MKLIILQKNLKEGLFFTERISSKSFSLPILNNILFETEKNFLKLSATNLEIGIKWQILAKVEKEGKIAIPAKIIAGLINFLPEDRIVLEKKGLNLLVQWKNNQTLIKGFDAEEFPIIPSLKEGQEIKIPAKIFCYGLKQISDIPVLSSTRPEISGVYFSFRKKIIKIAATDSFRLGEKTLSFEDDLINNFSLIVPQKTTKEIISIFGEREENIKILFSPNQIQFETLGKDPSQSNIQLVSHLVEGEYPNYEEILPKNFKTEITLSKNQFLNEIRAASLFSPRTNEVKLKIKSNEGKIEIFSQNPDSGEYKGFLDGKIKGENLEIIFNWRFLLEGISNIKSEEIVFRFSSSEGPALLKGLGDDSYFYVLMPIKI